MQRKKPFEIHPNGFKHYKGQTVIAEYVYIDNFLLDKLDYIYYKNESPNKVVTADQEAYKHYCMVMRRRKTKIVNPIVAQLCRSTAELIEQSIKKRFEKFGVDPFVISEEPLDPKVILTE